MKLAKKDGSAKPAAPATKTAAPKVGQQYITKASCIYRNTDHALVQKTTATKAAAPKKVAAPKKTATKAAAPKKTATTKKAAAAKPKANTGTKRKTPAAVCFTQ